MNSSLPSSVEADGEGVSTSSPAPIYEEHCVEMCCGFKIADVTSRIKNHEHDDLIWVGCQDDGKWLTAYEVYALIGAIRCVLNSHLKRRGREAV